MDSDLKDVQCISCQLHGKKVAMVMENGYCCHFSVPTLMGHGHLGMNGMRDVYIFLFKYTDSSGNGNNADWSKSPVQ